MTVVMKNRIASSLWESPVRHPSLTTTAAIDHFFLRRSDFDAPISMLRHAPNDLLQPDEIYDSAVLGWLPGLLSDDDYKKLSDWPTLVRVPDENVFTGVCHYSKGCDGYLTGCNSCPAVRQFASNHVPKILTKKINNYNLLKRKAFVCPSHWIAQKARASLALQNENIQVIRNPIDEQFFLSKGSMQKNSNFTVLFVASQVFDPVKGFNLIANKLESLAASGEIEVRVAGNPGKRAKDFSSIQFLGRLNARKLSEEYKKAWVTIVPSKSEASGNVVGESLASGTPTLVRNVDGLGEIASQVSPELLFNTDDELFEKLFSINFKSFHERSEDLVEVAQQQHPKIVARKYVEVLKSL